MTPLDTKANRDLYGIDTFERGLVYAALLLRSSNTNPDNTRTKQKNPYYNAVRIALNNTNTLVVIQGKLPYDNNLALRGGGSFIKSLGVYDNADPNPFLYQAPASNPIKLTIIDSPFWVNTLERYFAWTASNLLSGFLDLETGQQQGSIQFLEEDALEPSILLNVSLPINYNQFLNSGNLIYAIQSVISATSVIDADNNINELNNASLFSNNLLIGN